MATETHAGRAYQHLKGKILAGNFEPGTRLLYGPIGKEIGVSATPVREAAGRLANEGLLDLVPQRGAVVRALTAEELRDIYEVRLALEPFAAGLAAERATDKQLAKMRRSVAKMHSFANRQANIASPFAGKRLRTSFDQADFAFHLAVIEATANRALQQTAGQSHVLTRIFGIRRHRYDAASMQRTCGEHDAILLAIEKHDSAAACNAAEQHIRNGLSISLDAAYEKT